MGEETCTENDVMKCVWLDSGDLEVAAEFSTKDKDAAGSVDFVVLLNTFVISVLEVTMLFCHVDASFLCILKVGVNFVKSICGKQWLHRVKAPDWGNLFNCGTIWTVCLCVSVGRGHKLSVYSIGLTMHVLSRGSSTTL